MKTYLNRTGRNDYCVIALAAAKTEEMLKTWEKNLTSSEHKALSMAKTYIFKFMDSIQTRMDKNFVEQLIRDLKSSEILVLPKLQAQREFRNRKLDDGFVQVDRDTILNLAEHALTGCESCNKCDWRECDLRQVYMELDIDPFNPEATDCQYKVNYGKKVI